jgi:hypothetical protein
MMNDVEHVDQAIKQDLTPRNKKNGSIKMMKSPKNKSWQTFSEDEWPCPDYRIESIVGIGSYGVVAKAVQISTG